MARDDHRIVIERESSAPLLWFLAGGVLGAGLALLFAPQSGDKTRRLVGRKLGKLRDAAEDAIDDLRDSLAAGGPEPVHRSAADSETEELEPDEELSAADSDGVGPEAPERRRRGGITGTAREELEQRLAAARARRHRALAEEDEEPVA